MRAHDLAQPYDGGGNGAGPAGRRPRRPATRPLRDARLSPGGPSRSGAPPAGTLIDVTAGQLRERLPGAVPVM
ncbi:hypothetical protein QCN29_02980 [Streptomyces sp. HNM0663]|uniref:Uncharacterized protein n=1 Tax=Streptomyces chengmaiensis TaxID=3040919 RepID=A0ABT6HHP4_9ACTN|nr:hypothetical protein [Streptomyces chengmaiensis]MDH2387768.1 hypothetical protein [Streptomyces chengmaiensis]